MKTIKNKNSYTTFIRACILGSLVAWSTCNNSKLPAAQSLPGIQVNQPTQFPTPITDAMITAATGFPFLQRVLKDLQADNTSTIGSKNEADYAATALHYAAKLGDPGIVKVLLEWGAAIDAVETHYGNTPLHTAVSHRQLGSVNTLLQASNVNICNASLNTPLHLAVQEGDRAIVNALLGKSDTEVNLKNANNETPLLIAYRKAVTDPRAMGIFNDLLKNPKTNVNEPLFDNQQTILHRAVTCNQQGIVQAFLQYPGININITDQNGYTPFYYAISLGYLNIVQAFLGCPRINLNVIDHYGYTPFYYAIHFGHFGIVQALLGWPGIDVNFIDRYGFTPLYYATHFGHLDMVRALLAHPRINPHAGGFRPVEFAERRHAETHHEVYGHMANDFRSYHGGGFGGRSRGRR